MESRETTPLIEEPDVEVSVRTKPVYNTTSIIISLWLGSFLSALDSTVVASTMSGIAEEFHDTAHISWIATSYMLTNTAFQPLYGTTSDVVGRKHCLVFAQCWFGFGCLLCSFSGSLTQFSIARAIAGVGGGGLSALSSIIVSDIVSLEERGMYQGYANLMYATLQALGGPIGGLCLQTIGWRWMFAVQAPLTVICMILAVKHVNIVSEHFPKPEDRFSKENLKRIDFIGSGCLVCATSSILFLLSTSPSKLIRNALVLVAVVGVLAFIYIENYFALVPVIPPRLFKGVLGLTLFIAGFGTLCYFNILFVVPLYLETIQDVSASGAGVYIIFQVVPVLFGSLYAGSYLRKTQSADEQETNRVIQSRSGELVIGSLLAELLGLIIIRATVTHTGVESDSFNWKFLIVLGLCSCGVGVGVMLVLLLVLLVAIVGKEGQALASSMNYLFRSTGQVLAVSISLAVYNNHLDAGLSTFLRNKPEGSRILHELLQDSGYLRKGLDPALLLPILQIYRDAFAVAFIPGGFAAFIGVLLLLVVILRGRS